MLTEIGEGGRRLFLNYVTENDCEKGVGGRMAVEEVMAQLRK
jgi:hypothetical protein